MIKLPFVSRKSFETLLENNKALNNARIEANNMYISVQKDLLYFQETNLDLGNQLDIATQKLNDTKKEVAVLKRLLTKNGIEYKKEKK